MEAQLTAPVASNEPMTTTTLNPETNDTGTSESELIPAQVGHLAPNRTLYIRGQRATIVAVDLPNVFWKYDECDIVKHRSFTAAQDMFTVPKDTPLGQLTYMTPDARMLDTFTSAVADYEGLIIDEDGDEDDEDDEDIILTSGENYASPMQFIDHDDSSSEDDEETAPGSSPTGRRESLHAAFARLDSGMRNGRLVEFKDLHDTSVEAEEVTLVSTVRLDSCTQTKVKIGRKVAKIMVYKCNQLELEYNSVISTVEFVDCQQVKLHCTDSSGTVLVERVSYFVFRFPATFSDALCVATESQDVNVIAYQGEDEDQTKECAANTSQGFQKSVRWTGSSFVASQVLRDASGHLVD